MMAMQVRNEEYGRRAQRMHSRSTTGENEDVGDGQEDQGIDEGYEECGEEQGTDEDDGEGQDDAETNEASTPEEGTDDGIDQCSPDDGVEKFPACDEANLNKPAATEDVLDIGGMNLVDDTSTTGNTIIGSTGTAAIQDLEEEEVDIENIVHGMCAIHEDEDDGSLLKGANALDKEKGSA
jgi:hypothetical protein